MAPGTCRARDRGARMGQRRAARCLGVGCSQQGRGPGLGEAALQGAPRGDCRPREGRRGSSRGDSRGA
eukprot:4037356-Alexandrium_andersonii.AAC.1